MNGLLGANASRSSHEVVATAGEAKANNETVTSAEVRYLSSDHCTLWLCW